MPSPSSSFRWDPRTGQYVDARGRFVSRRAIRSEIDRVLDREMKNARELALGLRDGAISLEAWRLSMRDVIKSVHLLDAAAAKGGWAQLTADDYGRIGAIVKKEYQFLEKFTRGISTGRVPLDGRVPQRAMMYVEAGPPPSNRGPPATMAKAGFRWEQNILHPADHCGGCLGETARGRVRIGKLVPIGRRQCLRRCRCTLSYFKSRTGP
jgi:hypothetical protein